MGPPRNNYPQCTARRCRSRPGPLPSGFSRSAFATSGCAEHSRRFNESVSTLCHATVGASTRTRQSQQRPTMAKWPPDLHEDPGRHLQPAATPTSPLDHLFSGSTVNEGTTERRELRQLRGPILASRDSLGRPAPPHRPRSASSAHRGGQSRTGPEPGLAESHCAAGGGAPKSHLEASTSLTGVISDFSQTLAQPM